MLTSQLFALTSILGSIGTSFSYDERCNNNFVTYWGQNSYSIGVPDKSQWEKPVKSYCQDDTVDIINMAFLHVFNAGTNKLPEINLSYHCDSTFFQGTSLLTCPAIGEDIKYCQSQGKKVIMSLGGAAGSYGFSNDADATRFAKTVWDLFLGGSSNTRPFGSAVLDGVDLDIEGGGTTGYPAFINSLRSYYSQDTSKKYYITGAPQCPFPDAFLGSALTSAWFDMVYVQFYNNYCGASDPSQFNFGTWHNWAVTNSVNKNVKVYLGVPGSAKSASRGYIPASQLNSIIKDTRSRYSSFGGVMAWDASTSDMNTDGGSSFAKQVKQELKSGATCSGNPGTTTVPPKTSTTTTSTSATTSQPVTSSSPPTSTSTGQPSKPTVDPNCPVQGGSCTGNQMGCNGYDYARCDNSKWLLSPCSNNKSLYCVKGASGVYCDWATGKDVQSCSVSRSLHKRESDTDAVVKGPLIDFILGDDTTTSQYTTLVRIITTGHPFSNQWKVELALPDGQNITSITRGTFTQQGNLVSVLSEVSKEPEFNMAILIEIKGNQVRSPTKSIPPITAQFWDLGSLMMIDA
ncbi:Chitinase 2 [Basidiobolus ranarum]|uniref:chitinase n=1 Tax=Basidiobolus ranarum TaxID=34480 RepID=A0ABR2WUF9_9FUNG